MNIGKIFVSYFIVHLLTVGGIYELFFHKQDDKYETIYVVLSRFIHALKLNLE